MPIETEELICYNKGCGQTFRLADNSEDACTHHPGVPLFHDAYKGWTCCNKRSTDFTEFLNFKGCTKSAHSNVKPVAAEKPAVERLGDDEVIEYKPPVRPAVNRPASSTPMVDLKAEVSASLSQQVKSLSLASKSTPSEPASTETALNTCCSRSGCDVLYQGSETDPRCKHHPGYPVFHEGLKFWTCCQKRTTDFTAFLQQQGCCVGTHEWTQGGTGAQGVECRHDWHQTGTDVVVSVFAKKYDPSASRVQLSPVRLKIELFFPEQEASFTLDVQLRGVVDVVKSSACMFGTKLEVKLRKAEPGSWSTLGLPETVETTSVPAELPVEPVEVPVDDETVDLSDL